MYFFKRFLKIILDRFDLHEDKAEEKDIVEEISRGVELRGAKLWVLVLAIFIASIGLNVNSTAVIIGAMLISPLMGPIMGVGLGIATYDLELVKKASRSMGFAAAVSLVASAFYFLLSPLSEAQSELLARTTPTIWDVFIAFIGGLAGMVGATRASKGNVVPGVAISTALMPPLCTAGYSLANGQISFFLGAVYLFFINSVFICLGTLIVVRLLNFQYKSYVDREFEIRTKRYIFITVFLTAVPSLFMAYRIVHRGLIESRVKNLIASEFSNETQIINKSIDYTMEPTAIAISIFDPKIDKVRISNIEANIGKYGLSGFKLKLRNIVSSTSEDLATIRTGILEDIYARNENIIKDKDEKIRILENEVLKLKQVELPASDIEAELKVQYPTIKKLYLAKVYSPENFYSPDPSQKGKAGHLLLAYIEKKDRTPRKELDRIRQWLSLRTKSEETKIIVDR